MFQAGFQFIRLDSVVVFSSHWQNDVVALYRPSWICFQDCLWFVHCQALALLDSDRIAYTSVPVFEHSINGIFDFVKLQTLSYWVSCLRHLGPITGVSIHQSSNQCQAYVIGWV